MKSLYSKAEASNHRSIMDGVCAVLTYPLGILCFGLSDREIIRG